MKVEETSCILDDELDDDELFLDELSCLHLVCNLHLSPIGTMYNFEPLEFLDAFM